MPRPSCFTALVASPLFVVMLAAPARALDTEGCVRAYEAAQRNRKDGRLVAAREELLACAQASCPAVASKDCTRWLREVDDEIPSVVVGAKDEGGHDVADARLLVDGAEVAKRLDGAPIAVDPGRHRVRLEHGSASGEEAVVLRVGEKNRRIDVVLRAAPATPSVEGPKAAAFVLGGVGVAALGVFAYLGLTAKSQLDDLGTRCGGHCPSSEVDPIRRRALFADIALGVSVLSLGAAAYVLFSPRGEPAVTLALGARAGGASLELRGGF